MANTLKSQINALVSISILLGLGFWIPSHFSFTRTDSLDHRLFYIAYYSTKETNRVKNGSFIMFRNNHPLISGLIREAKTDKIIKKVVCSEGSMLKVVNRDFFCDGQKLGRATEKTPSGRTIEPFIYNGIVPAGNYFVMGNSPDSFDSRYFGFVEKKSIIALAYPII